jgi:acyl-CoA thioester hydrolase
VTQPLPPLRDYRLELIVGDGDVDMLGHASNIAFVRWIQEIAISHSAAVGFDFDAYQRLGSVFVVVRHEVDYVRPALLGDVIDARTWIASVMVAKCQRATELVRRSDGRLLARALTTWGFVDLTTLRPKRIHESLLVAFAPFVR